MEQMSDKRLAQQVLHIIKSPDMPVSFRFAPDAACRAAARLIAKRLVELGVVAVSQSEAPCLDSCSAFGYVAMVGEKYDE